MKFREQEPPRPTKTNTPIYLIKTSHTYLVFPKNSEGSVEELFNANRIGGGGTITIRYDEEMAIFDIWPGSILVIRDKEGMFYNLSSPDDPKDFLICPKCKVYWKKRTKHPKQCPSCHKLLSGFSLKDLKLENFLTTIEELRVFVKPMDRAKGDRINWKTPIIIKESEVW
jgi:hypothetical protein